MLRSSIRISQPLSRRLTPHFPPTVSADRLFGEAKNQSHRITCHPSTSPSNFGLSLALERDRRPCEPCSPATNSCSMQPSLPVSGVHKAQCQRSPPGPRQCRSDQSAVVGQRTPIHHLSSQMGPATCTWGNGRFVAPIRTLDPHPAGSDGNSRLARAPRRPGLVQLHGLKSSQGTHRLLGQGSGRPGQRSGQPRFFPGSNGPFCTGERLDGL